MAQVLVEISILLNAIEKATAVLRPKLNEWKSSWGRDEQHLSAMREAAEWAQEHPFFGNHVVIDMKELALIADYLTPGDQT